MTRVSTALGSLVACTALTVAACASSEAGSPRAASGSAPSGLAELDPCSLLSDSDRTGLGLSAGDRGRADGSKVCDWSKRGDWGVAVVLHADTGFQDANLQGSVATSVHIGKHPAHQVEDLGGGRGCVLFLEISPTSLAQISTTVRDMYDTAKACGKATQVAQIIDPKLP